MDNHHLFNNPWCPLFGNLPVIDNPPSSPASRSIEIIKEARELFGALDTLRDDSYPDPQRIADLYAISHLSADVVSPLSKSVLTSIRFIYFRIWEIMFRAQWHSGKWNEYGQPRYENPYCDDHNHLKIAADQVTASFLIEEALETNGIDLANMRKVLDTHGPGILFALYAICEAWQTLKDSLIEGEDEKSPVVLERLFISLCVMERARAEERKIERRGGYESLSSEYDLVPSIEAQRKMEELSRIRSHISSCGWKLRKPILDAEKDAIRAEMIEIGRRRNLKLNSVAANLHERFNKSESTLRHLFTKEEFELAKCKTPD